MRELETHVVLNAIEADLYVRMAQDCRNLIYNDFSVAAYIDSDAKLEPGAATEKAAGAKGKAKALGKK